MNKEALIESLRKKGFSDTIVNAFLKVKREDFVPERLVGYSYDDIALPIEAGASLSQPSTIAFMLSLLELKQGQKILEIGSGSGYVLALTSEIVKDGKVYGIERLKDLAVKSKRILANDSNVEIFIRNGFKGLPEFAPYDRILISASAEEIPKHLLEQLKDEGIMVCPVGTSVFQIKKEKGEIIKKEFQGFAFVPLIKEGLA